MAYRPVGWSRNVKIVRLSQKERERPQQTRKDHKIQLLKSVGGKCVSCGYNRSWASLQFHHIERDTKNGPISDLLSRWWLSKNMASKERYWSQLQEEIKKCALLCSNCHLAVTHPEWENHKEETKLRTLRYIRYLSWYREWIAAQPLRIQKLLKELWKAACITNLEYSGGRASNKLRRLRPDLARRLDEEAKLDMEEIDKWMQQCAQEKAGTA